MYKSKALDMVLNGPFFAEFDQFFNLIPASNTFPFHNVIVEKDWKTYKIELAVAGFKQDELEILLEKNILTVKGHKKSEDETATYIHHGIAARQFTKRFAIGKEDKTEVSETHLQDGILTIVVTRITPSEDRVQVIPIGKKVSNQGTQLLNE